uniref:Uncharacterized protein n=1 Tax=Amphiprion percula TaxID=161767 RepID=A0A3P8SQS5_AMPPE
MKRAFGSDCLFLKVIGLLSETNNELYMMMVISSWVFKCSTERKPALQLRARRKNTLSRSIVGNAGFCMLESRHNLFHCTYNSFACVSGHRSRKTNKKNKIK